jgi:hypothetical protein
MLLEHRFKEVDMGIKLMVLMVFVMAVLQQSAYSAPPYMWYATHSIENYDGNGDCGRPNLWACHDDADGFAAAVNARGLSNTWYRYNRRDSECTANRWSGYSAEINYVDFLFYAGHGCSKGPVLGCNPGYPIVNWEDIRFGGNGYLKWVQAAACTWFVNEDNDNWCPTDRTVWQRWSPCFRGVHTVQGHRAGTWDTYYSYEMNNQFWVDWCERGYTIYDAWRHSQIDWVYEEMGKPGLVPAAGASTSEYGEELFSQATDAPAPNGMNWIRWSTVGYPQY